VKIFEAMMDQREISRAGTQETDAQHLLMFDSWVKGELESVWIGRGWALIG
jgi:hypothetical protein